MLSIKNVSKVFGGLEAIAVAVVLEALLLLRPQGIAGDRASLIPPRE